MSGHGSVAGNISKGPGHIAIDGQLNYQENGDYVRRPAIRAALANPDNRYVDLLRSVFRVPEAVVRYVEYHWYYHDITAPQVWWKDKQPVEPLFRQSLIEAIDLAGDLPIDTYWMPIGHRNVDRDYVPLGIYRPDEYPFEVIMMKSETQLTRLIVTPPIPAPRSAEDRFTEPSNIWVVKAARDVLPIGERRIDDGIAVVNLYEESQRREPYR
ncbi:MAG: hypothetical protein ETSY1_13285 [Candidatus Entotheonella factor]|uniref:Uncharacterized protein n=1 Tax=Entotheonella factor TaxID=1429438 RepID=W4LPY0_ENTF1|nr:hypothetical protein [Candidatus Entotheonella palauensis]ETW99909.1 MAG: hypothetical protein ETSY1_13285 [Candidatus Entotheonella factor]